LKHLSRQSIQNFETIVVDSSDNNLTEELIKNWPQVRYFKIWNGRNNMPQARNLGIRQTSCEIVAFIDDDSLVFPNWLESIISGYSLEENIGGVGGYTIDRQIKIDSKDKRRGVILSDGTTIPNFSIESAEHCYVEWLVGCNMSFKRSILNEICGFDPKYGGDNSYEEVDMAVRVRKAGYQLLWNPTAKVEHLRVPRDPGVVTRNYENPLLRYHQAHNQAYFVLKNIGINKHFIKYIFKTIYGMSIYSVKKHSFKIFSQMAATLIGYLSGFWDAFRYKIRFGRE
jgi:hypothetical protein